MNGNLKGVTIRPLAKVGRVRDIVDIRKFGEVDALPWKGDMWRYDGEWLFEDYLYVLEKAVGGI